MPKRNAEQSEPMESLDPTDGAVAVAEVVDVASDEMDVASVIEEAAEVAEEPEAWELSLQAEQNSEELFQQLEADEAAAKAEAIAKAKEMVVAIADGQIPPADEIRAVMKTLDWDAAKLREKVKLVRYRREQYQLVLGEKTAEANIKRSRDKLARLKSEFDEFVRQHEEEEVVAIRARDEAVQALSAAFTAKSELAQTAGPEALAVLERMSARQRFLDNEQRALEDQIHTKELALAQYRDNKAGVESAHMTKTDFDRAMSLINQDIERVSAGIAEMKARRQAMIDECGLIDGDYLAAQSQIIHQPEAIW